MSLGNEWDNITPASASKLNGVTLTYGTGAYLATLDKTKHKLLVCTSTGSGYTLDHLYLCTTDGTNAIDITPLSSIDINLIEVLYSNPEVIDLLLTKTDDLKKAQWIETVTSTGTIEDKTDVGTGERSIRLRPNGTSGSGATISYPHLKLDFAKPSVFTTKLQIETATSIALHSGVGADDVTAADSNTIKYNAEVCTATNNNWFLRTASGSANSTSDTGTAISANRVGIKITHRPDLGTPETNISVAAGAAFQKTSNIPVSGLTADNNVIKHSVKNSTAADRPLLMYGCRLSYITGSSWGYG